jgi:hypothetical protein
MNNMGVLLSSILALIIFIVFKQARVRTTHAVTSLAKGLYFFRERNFKSYLQSKQGLMMMMMMIIHPLSSASVRPSVCLSVYDLVSETKALLDSHEI